jgi:hypothetical protein
MSLPTHHLVVILRFGVVLRGGKNWSLILGKQNRPRIFERRKLMKLFGLIGGMNEIDKLRIFSSPIRDFLAVVLLLIGRIDQTPQNKTQY